MRASAASQQPTLFVVAMTSAKPLHSDAKAYSGNLQISISIRASVGTQQQRLARDEQQQRLSSLVIERPLQSLIYEAGSCTPRMTRSSASKAIPQEEDTMAHDR